MADLRHHLRIDIGPAGSTSFIGVDGSVKRNGAVGYSSFRYLSRCFPFAMEDGSTEPQLIFLPDPGIQFCKEVYPTQVLRMVKVSLAVQDLTGRIPVMLTIKC